MSLESSTFAQRKYQVFISSTFNDLVDARQTAIRIVMMRGHLPIALEGMNVPAEPIPTVIQDAIRNSQIYLVFLGHRYGSLVPGTSISYTEREYELAIENGLVVVPFVLSPDAIKAKRDKMRRRVMDTLNVSDEKDIYRHQSRDPALVADVEELQREEDLFRFHSRVKQDQSEFPIVYTPFVEKDPVFSAKIMGQLELAEKAADSRRLRAWIKAPPDLDLARALFALSRNAFLVQVSLRLSDFEKLDARCSAAEDLKRSLASYFARTYFGVVAESKTHLFFESGSTIAYLAKELGPRLKSTIPVAGGSPEIRISTNNVLAYLQLWLIDGVPCSPFPWGPPEDRYGAAFGCLDHYYPKGAEPDPEFPPIALDEKAKKAIGDLGADPFSPNHWSGNVLLLGATSGLQLGHDLITTSGDRRAANGCVGPHVGSYRNKLFKRFMFDTRKPIMLFFTSDKIDLPVSLEDCHFVFDDQYPYLDVIRSYPLAFCVGCLKSEQAALTERLSRVGMKILLDTHPREHTAVIARNDAFISVFEKAAGFTPREAVRHSG